MNSNTLILASIEGTTKGFLKVYYASIKFFSQKNTQFHIKTKHVEIQGTTCCYVHGLGTCIKRLVVDYCLQLLCAFILMIAGSSRKTDVNHPKTKFFSKTLTHTSHVLWRSENEDSKKKFASLILLLKYIWLGFWYFWRYGLFCDSARDFSCKCYLNKSSICNSYLIRNRWSLQHNKLFLSFYVEVNEGKKIRFDIQRNAMRRRDLLHSLLACSLLS